MDEFPIVAKDGDWRDRLILTYLQKCYPDCSPRMPLEQFIPLVSEAVSKYDMTYTVSSDYGTMLGTMIEFTFLNRDGYLQFLLENGG